VSERATRTRSGLWSRVYEWLDLRMDIGGVLRATLLHPVPFDVNWWYVLGSATLTSFIVQVVTGVALAFAYVPSTEHAYSSLDWITNQAFLGAVVRGMHFWGATAMVVLILAHMTRVFLFGSFKFPREVSWLSGSLLLLFTLAMAFTGQLLRWDQDSFWGIVVLAEGAGKTPLIGPVLAQLVIAGQQVGGATLTRFFATHVFLIPAGMFLLVGIHLYLVVRRGISEPPRPDTVVVPNVELDRYERVLETRGVPFFPDVAWRDFAASAALVLALLFLSIAIGPPAMRIEANPTIVNTNPRPDWYFLPLFALLALVPAEVENLVLLGLPVAIGVFLFAVPLVANRGERHWSRRPWSVAAVGAGLLAGAVLLVAGNVAPWSPNIDAVAHGALPPSVTANLDAEQMAGATLFVRHGCFACHSIQGSGGLAGTDLTTVGDRLTANQMTTRILNGGRNMPAFSTTLTPQQIDQLVAFLRTLRAKR
jgi:ubiquinol-cytochrome c reductase cytochrome b subunit